MKNREYKSIFIVYSFILFLLTVSVACSNDHDANNNSNSNGDKEIAGNTLVTIQPERTKLLRNPMTGWVIYAGLGDGLSDTFWEDYDNLESSKGKIKVSDYATTLFIRGAWSDFNPEENVYVWKGDVNTKPAKRFRMLVEGAKERNLKLAFSFIVDSRDKSYDFTPKYVKEAPNVKGYETMTGSVRVWSPYPDDPVFQQYYSAFVKEFAKTFDDPDNVQFISGSGLGKWGEFHSLIYTTGDNGPRESVFDWVTDLYSSTFKRVPLLLNYHRWVASRTEWDGTKYDSESERLMNKAVDKGYSLRQDAFGMKTYYSTWERNYAASKKFQRPIVMEGGWVKSSHGGSIKNDGYSTYADVRRGEFEEAKGAFVNMMDFRYNKNIINGETSSWFNDAFYLVEEFITEGGYRLYPGKLSLPQNVKNGSTVTITHRWHNLGWAYCPTNIPQWKGRFKVAFALLDKTSLSPKYVFVDDEPQLSDWIKGTPQSYTFTPSISNVTTGDYIWAVGLVDTEKDNQIGIQISAKENITPEGWLKLTDVTVR